MKQTPFDNEIEKAVLGELLLTKSAMDLTVDILRPETFYNDAHSTIYRTIMSMQSKGVPVELLSLTSELRNANRLDVVGGAYYVTTLSNAPSGYQIEHHSLILTQLYVRRQLIEASEKIERSAYEDNKDPLEQLDSAERRLQEIRTTIDGAKKIIDFPTMIKTEIDQKKEAVKKGVSFTGVSTGNSKIDKAIGGFQKSDLIMLAARPGQGKTTRALIFAKEAAKANEPVAMFSLEMSQQQLVRKFIIEQSNVYGAKYTENRLTEYDLQVIDKAGAELMKLPIEIYDNPSLTPLQLKGKLRKFIKKFGKVSLVIVDYIQLMKAHEKSNSREQEISSISRNLKEVAKEFDVPIIALAQLSRDVEKRPGSKRPQLSDLRESGSLEQDSDLVMFIYRPEYYFPYGKHPDSDYSQENISEAKYNKVSELIIEKFRGGKPNRAIIEYFDGAYSRFSESHEEVEKSTESADDLNIELPF